MQRTLKAALCVAMGAGALILMLSAIGRWIPNDTAPPGPLLSMGAERVTVDVLNAGGVDGMARIATDRLRAAGFDVVSLGNAASFDQDSTIVIDRVGSLQKAAAVAGVLGVRSVTSERDANLFVDVTVRLGSDWEAPAGEVVAEPDENGLVGWLLRFARGQR